MINGQYLTNNYGESFSINNHNQTYGEFVNRGQYFITVKLSLACTSNAFLPGQTPVACGTSGSAKAHRGPATPPRSQVTEIAQIRSCTSVYIEKGAYVLYVYDVNMSTPTSIRVNVHVCIHLFAGNQQRFWMLKREKACVNHCELSNLAKTIAMSRTCFYERLGFPLPCSSAGLSPLLDAILLLDGLNRDHFMGWLSSSTITLCGDNPNHKQLSETIMNHP